MGTINFEEYVEKPKNMFTVYEEVLGAIGKIFKQDPKKLNIAFTIAGNFDTLIMFCTAAREMEIDVETVAKMSRETTIPQMHLREIRPNKETTDEPKARVYSLGKDRQREQ